MVECTIWDNCEDLTGRDSIAWEFRGGTNPTDPDYETHGLYGVAIEGNYSIQAQRLQKWTDVMCRGWTTENWADKDYLSIYIAGYAGGLSGAATGGKVYLYDDYDTGLWPYGHVASYYIGGLTTTLSEFRFELNNSGEGVQPNSVEVGFDWTRINKIRIRGGGHYVDPSTGYINNDIYFDNISLCTVDESPDTGPQTEEQEEEVIERTDPTAAEAAEESRVSAGEPAESPIARRRIKNYTQIVGVAPTNPVSAPIPVTWSNTGADWTATNPAPVLPRSATIIYNNAETVAAAGTAVQLSTTSIVILSITIKANNGNANNIYVGDINVAAANGFELGPGESISMNIDNVNKVWIDAAANGDGVTYIAIGR